MYLFFILSSLYTLHTMRKAFTLQVKKISLYKKSAHALNPQNQAYYSHTNTVCLLRHALKYKWLVVLSFYCPYKLRYRQMIATTFWK